MSTKFTIAHGDEFHFYNEVFDYDHVYLELNTTHFEAAYGRVMVPVPIHIWETIRHLGGARFDLIDKEDVDLLATIEQSVDRRIAEYQLAMRENSNQGACIAFFGALLYGTADSPRDEQIRRGMDYFRQERQRQREVKARIVALRSAQRRSVE